jgi:exodeoxyribonuclease V beta subunit
MPAWTLDSFTALARRSANENHGLDEEEVESISVVSPLMAQSTLDFEAHLGYDLSALPKGARTGECLHAILENTNWSEPLGSGENLSEIQRQTSRYAVAPAQTEQLAIWLEDILQTPLFVTTGNSSRSNDAIKHFCLKDISMPKMIREWRFDSLQKTASTTQASSYLRGYVDLVFEHDGKYYIVDYKSNWLGGNDAAYSPQAIERAMLDHQYNLQAQIYSAALRNFLAARLGAENVNAVYGGVLYLYLRAMKSSQPGLGVHHVA